MTKLVGLLFIASTALTACGSDSKEEFVEAAAPVEGIYKISTYTRNDVTCAPGGTSQLGNDGYAVAVIQEVVGLQMLSLTSCASPADCRGKVAAMRAGDSFDLEFYFATNELDGDAFVGHGGSSGSLEGGKCVGGERHDFKLSLEGTQLTFEQKVTPADPYAPRDGICWTDQAQKSADGNSCKQMEVLSATFVEAL